MSERDWDKELAKVDKQLQSLPQEAQPEEREATAMQDAELAMGRAATGMGAILRLSLSVLLGVAVLFWPYDSRCGIALAGYLFVVAAVVASGVWSAVWTWRHRTGRAHALAILLIVWGLVLGATEVLPRAGYARVSLPWSCTG